MAVGAAEAKLDPTRDTLVNVNAHGEPVPSARFMGGREYDVIRKGRSASPSDNDKHSVLRRGLHLLPAIEQGSGPFAGLAGGWNEAPETIGEEMLALSWYLALMTDTCLGLTGAEGPVIVEGPFARNADYLDMLAAVRPDGVVAMESATGTSVGAALLIADGPVMPEGRAITPSDASAMQCYADLWRRASRA
jgi:hypothetical protein